MKNLIVLIAALLVFALNSNAQDTTTTIDNAPTVEATTIVTTVPSIAEVTYEQTSLWNGLADYLGVHPATWTTSQFRAEARKYAKSIGLEYTNHPTNGWNNIQILHHNAEIVLKVSHNRFTIDTFNTNDVSAIHGDIKYYVQGLGTIAVTDTTLNNIFEAPVEVSTEPINTIQAGSISQDGIQVDSMENGSHPCDCSNMNSEQSFARNIQARAKLTSLVRGSIEYVDAKNCAKASMWRYRKVFERTPKATLAKKVKKRVRRVRGKGTVRMSFGKWFNCKTGLCVFK